MLLARPIHLPTEDATAALAACLAPRFRPGDTLLLAGPVGAGKSAFARAFVRARLDEAEAEVPSPTYTLVQTYGVGENTIWHVDLYRLGSSDEAVELGLLAAMEEAICLIEWPERLGSLIPHAALRLDLSARFDPDAARARRGLAALLAFDEEAKGLEVMTNMTSADKEAMVETGRLAVFSGSPAWHRRLRGLDG